MEPGDSRDARRVQAVLAQPGQVHHEGVLELAVDVLLDIVEVCGPSMRLANSPPRISSQFGPHSIFSMRLPVIRLRGGGRRMLHLGRRLQVVVVEGEGLVVVVDLRQVGVGEDLHQQLPLAALARHDGTIGLADPAAVPAVLVLPLLGVADAGLGFRRC